MAYHVKEIFYSLQGEGANVGRPAVFCRFAGCNLWSGREEDRATATCRFCDTDFLGGYSVGSAGQFAVAIRQHFPDRRQALVILTGGEPTLQVDDALVNELHAMNCFVAMETNGTRLVPRGIDWITVSPKAGTTVAQTWGAELKIVVPQDGLDLDAMREWEFDHYFVQPRDGYPDAIKHAVALAMTDTRWRVSFQAHKFAGLR